MTENHETELAYLMTHRPTIAEVRRLNRETLMIFPLSMLNAILDAGLDLDRHAEAIVRWTPIVTDELVDVRFSIELLGKRMGWLAAIGHPDGELHFAALTRLNGEGYELSA